MRTLITGAGGQLGQDLLRVFQSRGDVVGLTRSDLDVTNASAVHAAIHAADPDVVVNAAAYTAVDDAEDDVESAFRINAAGALHVARASAKSGAAVVYVSTDYVFRGEAGRTEPYLPGDVAAPRNVYGASKLAGEHLTRQANERHWIVRTQWLYGPAGGAGSNFVETMLQLGRSGRELQIIDDQVGSPTFTADLAEGIADLVTQPAHGTFHIANRSRCTWFEFAQAIWEQAGLSPRVRSTTTEGYGARADRPRFGVLADDLPTRVGLQPLRPWRAALRAYLASRSDRDASVDPEQNRGSASESA